jgi:copper homeostasis protein
MLLEVIVQTTEDARAAASGGADRLEIVRDIASGGLTPSIAIVRAIAAETPLPLRVMVRENAGFDTDAGELRRMRDAIAEFCVAGVDGFVIGFARRGAPALDEVAAALDDTAGVRATFHRAFDSLDDPFAGIDAIAQIPQIDRILTSGGEGKREARAARLRACVERAGSRFTIIAGGGVDEEMLAHLAAEGCVEEVHIGRAARLGNDRNAAVSVERVRRLRHLMRTRNRDRQSRVSPPFRTT